MTREGTAFAWVLNLILFARGFDYITGNPFDMGHEWGESVGMPFYWGTACIVTSLLVTVALLRKKFEALQFFALVAFGINVMFAVQSADYRMLPVPWPPEDFRLLGDHVGHAVMWLILAVALWWREGINRRRNEILEEAEQ